MAPELLGSHAVAVIQDPDYRVAAVERHLRADVMARP